MGKILVFLMCEVEIVAVFFYFEVVRIMFAYEMKWNDMIWNDIKWDNVKWNDMKWNDMKWNDMKWNDIKWNDIKWNDIKWNDMKWNDGMMWLDEMKSHLHARYSIFYRFLILILILIRIERQAAFQVQNSTTVLIV